MKFTCQERQPSLPTPGVTIPHSWGSFLPRAVKVSLSKAQLLISNDFIAGENRSLLSKFSEELPVFLLADKSNS